MIYSKAMFIFLLVISSAILFAQKVYNPDYECFSLETYTDQAVGFKGSIKNRMHIKSIKSSGTSIFINPSGLIYDFRRVDNDGNVLLRSVIKYTEDGSIDSILHHDGVIDKKSLKGSVVSYTLKDDYATGYSLSTISGYRGDTTIIDTLEINEEGCLSYFSRVNNIFKSTEGQTYQTKNGLLMKKVKTKYLHRANKYQKQSYTYHYDRNGLIDIIYKEHVKPIFNKWIEYQRVNDTIFEYQFSRSDSTLISFFDEKNKRKIELKNSKIDHGTQYFLNKDEGIDSIKYFKFAYAKKIDGEPEGSRFTKIEIYKEGKLERIESITDTKRILLKEFDYNGSLVYKLDNNSIYKFAYVYDDFKNWTTRTTEIYDLDLNLKSSSNQTRKFIYR